MAYNELIKNFSKIREYMKDFYVYGFRSRDDYNNKSLRSYDNEKRRIESYLNNYMSFRRTENGKNVFISIDSRTVKHNPLYMAFKSKTFTAGDITLHFILFDILYDEHICITLNEIVDKIHNEYLQNFDSPLTFDDSTVRKKLQEYIKLGLVESIKNGRKMYYKRCSDIDVSEWCDAVGFFSETGMLGVVGSFILDKPYKYKTNLLFKHHYITYALDSEILYEILNAISLKSSIEILYSVKGKRKEQKRKVLPLKIFIGTGSGRHYLLAYHFDRKCIVSMRIDYIFSVSLLNKCERFDELRLRLSQMQQHMWGVCCTSNTRKLEHVEFTVHIGNNEEYIYNRLEREKRCGTVVRVNPNEAKFSADVYDSTELITWIRTFICRITSLNFSNKAVEEQFKQDIEDMYRLYDITKEDN